SPVSADTGSGFLVLSVMRVSIGRGSCAATALRQVRSWISRRPVVIVNHFQNTAPDVYQSQAGDRAAHKAAAQHFLQRGPAGDEPGGKPVVGPGQHYQPQAQDHAE